MGSIRKGKFGEVPDGRAVDLYILVNSSGLEARVMTYGGTLVSVLTPDRQGALADVVLGFDKLSPYLCEHPYLGCLVGRYANRIAGGSFYQTITYISWRGMTVLIIFMEALLASAKCYGRHAQEFRRQGLSSR